MNELIIHALGYCLTLFVCLFVLVEVIDGKVEAWMEARMLTDKTIREAIKMWFDPATRQEAIDKYGEIRDWHVSSVTDMSGLFAYMKDFNENISGWDTLNVTDMYCTFAGASSFNQPLEGWNTANVTNMFMMFHNAPCQKPSWYH